ncbi:MAG: hypothetical protein JWR54_3716 [Mucilaginibacter sp.]|nr:hypothetical protein [Mucilaginibacter sp.]
MRKLLAFILCTWVVGTMAQSKINAAKPLNVYGRDGKTVIAKVIVNTGAASKLFLLKSVQRKDTSNNYITTFYLGNKETTPLLDARILMKFSKPVIDVMPSFSAVFNSVSGLSDDHITYIFKAGRLDRDPGSVVVISFDIKSKDRVITEITGLDGIVP